MITIVTFILGAIVGSFLNVVALRWDLPRHGGASFAGRSRCVSCSKVLKWRELIPILSFFLLRAKCSGCGTKISWQYPLVELWTGLIFITIPYIFIPVFCLYIVITVYDFKHKIIPDELVYTSIILAILTSYLSAIALATVGFLLPTPFSLLDWLSGPILFIFFASIWFFSRGRAMGFGDAKLGLSVGLLLGASQGFSAIVLAFWLGAVSSVIYLCLNKIGFIKNAKKLTMKSEVPFAPFIIIGAWVSLAFHLNLFYVPLF